MSWLTSLFARKGPVPTDVKENLAERQIELVDQLAEIKGVTRDEVLAEVHRKADRITEGYRLANGHRKGRK